MTVRPHLVERALGALQEDRRRIRQAGARGAIAPDPVPLPPREPPAMPPALVSMETLEQAGLVPRPQGSARSRVTEEIALIRQQVVRGIPTLPTTDHRCARAVMVTSARPGEGKTFTALNLAASIADGLATPVLLVDADGRRGSLSELLKLGGMPGMRALAMMGAIAPASLLRQTAIPCLSVVTCEAAPGVGGLPAAEAMATAVQHLAHAFPGHIIVLDMPPALATADAGAMASLVGQAVLVVLAEKTQRNEVESALDVIDACPEIRLLLNRAGTTANDSFGARGSYDGYDDPYGS